MDDKTTEKSGRYEIARKHGNPVRLGSQLRRPFGIFMQWPKSFTKPLSYRGLWRAAYAAQPIRCNPRGSTSTTQLIRRVFPVAAPSLSTKLDVFGARENIVQLGTVHAKAKRFFMISHQLGATFLSR